MKVTYLFISILIFLSYIADAQDDLAFGDWEAHLPFQRGIAITQSPNKIYYSTGGALMSIEKSDLSLEFISKVEGLSDLGIADIKYDSESQYLLVIYNDSNIDVLTSEGIVNIADIKNNRGIIGDKRINHVHFDNGTAYFSTGFGMVSFNMELLEFGFTTQMGMQVNASCVQDNKLYAAAEDGLYTLDLEENYNFGDFGNWEWVEDEGLPTLFEAKNVVSFNGNLFLQVGNEIFLNNEEGFNSFLKPETGESIEFINAQSESILIGIRKESEFRSHVLFVNSDLEIEEGSMSCANFITYAIMEENGRVWYADEWNKFRYTEDKFSDCIRFDAPSPYSATVSEMRVQNGVLYVASGGVTEGFNFLTLRNGIYIFRDGQWLNINEGNNQAFKDASMLNCFVIAPQENSNQVFIGSFYSGLMRAKIDDGEYELFNSENSPIAGESALPEVEKISGLSFDQNQNLWISAYEADKPLIARTPEGSFHAFEVDISKRTGQIEIDDNGYKWIQLTGSAGGVLVYDDNGTVKDPSDDRQRFYNSSNSALKINTVNCIEKDLNGDIWVGTANGPVIFECGSGVFEEFCTGSIRKVLEDSIAAELLTTEDIRAIGVDGANRKWLGTRNGIFVQSPDGREKIHRFTTENSPLFNNNIVDLAFDGESGIMYIASSDGIQAFKTLTTEGGRRHKNTAYAFPNPVRPEFDGLIAIKGLAQDATIKITDIRGQLVHQTNALGGQAHWDGRDYSGRKVATGVYLVFSNSRDQFDDPDTAVIKLMIVR